MTICDFCSSFFTSDTNLLLLNVISIISDSRCDGLRIKDLAALFEPFGVTPCLITVFELIFSRISALVFLFVVSHSLTLLESFLKSWFLDMAEIHESLGESAPLFDSEDFGAKSSNELFRITSYLFINIQSFLHSDDAFALVRPFKYFLLFCF